MVPAIGANSDLSAIIPRRLADTYARHLPIKVLPTPIQMPLAIRLIAGFDKSSSNYFMKGEALRAVRSVNVRYSPFSEVRGSRLLDRYLRDS
jgi:hypothetical protein